MLPTVLVCGMTGCAYAWSRTFYLTGCAYALALFLYVFAVSSWSNDASLLLKLHPNRYRKVELWT